MAGIFGRLGLSDTDRVFQAVVGQRVIYDEANAYINRVNAELDRVQSVFIERTTENFKERYKLAGGGHLDRRGPDGSYGTGKAYGYWDVAYPLEDFGRAVASNDVARAYMTVQELSNHIRTVTVQYVNTSRFELLKRLLKNTATTFVDDLHGSLTIQPLANGDSVLYPPVLGSESEATRNRYAESGYAAASISDTNDPYVTIVDELEADFGTVSGGDNIVTFINNAERAKTEALTDFDPVPDRFIRTGANTDIPVGLPNVPGRIIGRHKHGTWVSEWRWVPANYMMGIHLLQPAPLVRRTDPADTELWRGGIALVASDEEFPFQQSEWRVRFGLGAGNRLNGYVLELGTGGTYTIPTGYS
jgi:hypothetical protein